jgi:hypothetical protein
VDVQLVNELLVGYLGFGWCCHCDCASSCRLEAMAIGKVKFDMHSRSKALLQCMSRSDGWSGLLLLVRLAGGSSRG